MKIFSKSKKVILGISTLLIVVFAVVGAYLVSNKSEAQMDSNTFTLVNDSGNVEYKLSSDTEYKTLDSETDLPSGTSIKTDKESLAYVFFPDNSLVTIEAETEITIQVEENKINIDQIIGNTWHRVQTVTNGGEYNVKTPDTIASVRGTVFAVKAKPDDGTNVYVVESKVDVAGSGLIPANKYSQVKKYNEVKVGDIEEETKKSEWFTRNTEVDTVYEEEKIKKEDSKSFKEKVIKNLKDKNIKISKVTKEILGTKTKRDLANDLEKKDNSTDTEETQIRQIEQPSTTPDTTDTTTTRDQTTITPPRAFLDRVTTNFDPRSLNLKVTWNENNLSRSDRIVIGDVNTGEIYSTVAAGTMQSSFMILPLGTNTLKLCINDCGNFSTTNSFTTDKFSITQSDGNYFSIRAPYGIGTGKYYQKGLYFYFEVKDLRSLESNTQPVPNSGFTDGFSLSPILQGSTHSIRMCVYKDSNGNGTNDRNEPCISQTDTVEAIL